ncbi:MAG TPA: IclR family transcriptional regulator [Nitrospiraceae bacterium]|nr:IclR family transcriptional regulator [Nitrospiraceae bacterium]
MVVLQAIADDPGKLDIARLTKLLPYPRGTLYRIVTALLAEGLISESRGTYQLGHRLIHLASKSWETSDLRSAARDFIEALRNATGETVHLAVPSGTGMVYIDKLESPRTVRMTSRIGTRVELYSTSVGKAYLAALPEAQLRTVLASLDLRPRTDNTVTEIEALEAEICRTRERGYSYDNEENEPDIKCFGGAILDRSGMPVGGVSLSIPIYRYDEDCHREYARRVRETVAAISAGLADIV